MQLFLFLNDLAGRWPWLDALMRGVYIGTIPALALLLLALLTLAPRAHRAPSRGKVALATLLALGGAALILWGVEAWAHTFEIGTISPRPFMTRWVNLLIVEPQDNSFPCAEIIVAAILSIGVGCAHRVWGALAALVTLWLMVARLFCGSNYLADVAVGALVGVGLMLVALALVRAPRTRWARFGAGASGALTLAGTALGAFVVMAAMPRFQPKLQLPWASAAPTRAGLTAGAPVAAHGQLQEGEGVPMAVAGRGAPDIDASDYASEAEAQAMSKRATLFLPQSEAALRRVLTPRALPFALLDVEVAPVTWQDGSYRAAALRFAVDPAIPNARHGVAGRAASLVKAAFAADSSLDNVDITGVVTGDAGATSNSLMHFAGDEIPVFTASVQRRNLTLSAPQWANAANLDGGLWLRMRSKLWIDPKALPQTPLQPAPEIIAPRPAPTPPQASPIAPALAAPQSTPTAPDNAPNSQSQAPNFGNINPNLPRSNPIIPGATPVAPKNNPTAPKATPIAPPVAPAATRRAPSATRIAPRVRPRRGAASALRKRAPNRRRRATRTQ